MARCLGTALFRVHKTQASGRCGESLGSFLWGRDVNYVDALLVDELSLSKPEDRSVTAKYFPKAHDGQATAGLKRRIYARTGHVYVGNIFCMDSVGTVKRVDVEDPLASCLLGSSASPD